MDAGLLHLFFMIFYTTSLAFSKDRADLHEDNLTALSAFIQLVFWQALTSYFGFYLISYAFVDVHSGVQLLGDCWFQVQRD